MGKIIETPEMTQVINEVLGKTPNDLTRIEEVSYYNHNYYKTSNENIILLAVSDDDNCTEWLLIIQDGKNVTYYDFGESFTSEGDVIQRTEF